MKQKPYIVTQDKYGNWYCCKRGFDYIPVFGSIGDKRKAQKVCDTMNKSVGK